MTGERILLVDDAPAVLDPIRQKLELEGFTVHTAANGVEALEAFQQVEPDLVVLDLMMPRMDGLTACKRLRAASDVPIIVVSAKSEESDIVVSLELGADDYLSKPFRLNELVARIRAVLRRRSGNGANHSAPEIGDVLSVGQIVLDGRGCQVSIDGRSVALTPIEFRLLAELMKRPGEVISREDLLRTVWGYDGYDVGVVNTHIMRLRSKVETDPAAPRLILTVRGFGYKISPE